jgi:hypothetical protein
VDIEPVATLTNAPTAIKPLTATEQIKVNCYPQPTGDFNILQIQAEDLSNVQVDLYDLMGQKISSVYNGYLNTGSHTFKTDVSLWPAGMYCYRVKADGFNTSLKFIKQ